MNQSEFEEIHNWYQARENVTRVTLVVSDALNKQNLFCYKIEIILALKYHYLQFIIQFIEDKQQQTKK